MSGALIVGQSGGVTPVLNSSLAGVIAAAAASAGVDRIYGMRDGVRGLLERDLLPLDGLSESMLGRLGETPGAWLGSCRYSPSDDELTMMLDLLVELGVRYYVYIGGNDSAETSGRLSLLARRTGRDMYVVNVPKTIDNDLPDMDHSPGYPTAAAYVALCTRLLCLDTIAMRREEPVRIIEVKGRHSGWLAAAAAAFEADDIERPLLVHVPERALEADRVLADIESRLSRCGCAVLVVSEHAVDAAGREVGEAQSGYTDAFGHGDSTGPGAYLQRAIESRLQCRCRLEVLGGLQKVAFLPDCKLDRDEAFSAGQFAVRSALAGESDACVTLNREPGEGYRLVLGLTPLDRVARSERLLPDAFIGDGGKCGIASPTAEFRAWLRPLVAEVEPLIDRILDAGA